MGKLRLNPVRFPVPLSVGTLCECSIRFHLSHTDQKGTVSYLISVPRSKHPAHIFLEGPELDLRERRAGIEWIRAIDTYYSVIVPSNFFLIRFTVTLQ